MSDPFTQELPTTTDDLSADDSGRGCCGFSQVMKSGWMVGSLVIATIAATATAGYFAGRNSQTAAGPNVYFPPIDASAAISSEKFSIATGIVTERIEALFLLDHNSGLLQCSVIYPRLGRFMGLFTTNIGEALATGGKGGNYIMVTGMSDFISSNSRPAAPSVVYVLDTATGNYACYGVPFNRTELNANRQQQGSLVLISTGTANPVIDRDDVN